MAQLFIASFILILGLIYVFAIRKDHNNNNSDH